MFENSVRRLTADHMIVATLLGALFGIVLFVAEPLAMFHGRHFALGGTLPRILAFFVSAGAGIGLIAGTGAGAASALMRKRWATRTAAFVYGMFFVYLLFAYLLRALVVFEFTSITRSTALIVMLIVLPIFALVTYLLALRINARVPASPLDRRARLAMIAGLVVILGFVWGYRAKADAYVPDVRFDSRDKPHVIMIVLDALRWDRLSVYGHSRETSPNIDRLAREGVVFLQAHSHGPRTVYSMPSLFTSLYPSLHGMVHYRDLVRPLAYERTTIAEMLKDHGYSTAAVISNFYVGDGFQMTQGFDLTEQFGKLRQKLSLIWTLTKLDLITAPYHTKHWKAEAREVTEAALRWLHRLKDGPMFLYVHYMDTHHVYLPPPDLEDMFLDVENAPDPKETFDRADRYKKHGEPVGDADIEALKSYYDASIYYADREIGRILEEARRLSADRETIVIFTSDHGDEFLEHGDVFHTNMAFEELIHVPMIFWDPHRYKAGKQVSEIVRHIDVLPTIADITGCSPPDEATGRSLEKLIRGGEDFVAESIAEGPFNVSVNSGGWKAIYNDTLDTYFVFDLLNDPIEQSNLWSPDASEPSGLRLRLDDYIRATAKIDHGESRGLDTDSRRQLKALGYL